MLISKFINELWFSSLVNSQQSPRQIVMLAATCNSVSVLLRCKYLVLLLPKYFIQIHSIVLFRPRFPSQREQSSPFATPMYSRDISKDGNRFLTHGSSVVIVYAVLTPQSWALLLVQFYVQNVKLEKFYQLTP